LLPALSKARESANQVKCMSNLRSIGQGLAQYLDDYNQFYPLSYDYNRPPGAANTSLNIQGGIEQPNYAQYGYVHWSSFIYGRKDLGNNYPQMYYSTIGWEAFQCPSINNGGLPADDPSPGNQEPDQLNDDENAMPAVPPAYVDYQAPRMAYTANEAIMGRNKFILGFGQPTPCVRTYQWVRASMIRHSADTILVTEFNQDWHVVNDVPDNGSGPPVCKSHRPVNAYEAIIAYGGPGAYKLDQYLPSGSNALIRVAPEAMTPYPHIGSPAMGQTSTSLDWVGRNHGSFKLGTVKAPDGTVIQGWDLRTTNFLYCDGHVENKNILDTFRPWQWGDYMYSLVPGQDIKIQ
jgi:prepilin-type processing-associated H-X9-DG protein